MDSRKKEGYGEIPFGNRVTEWPSYVARQNCHDKCLTRFARFKIEARELVTTGVCHTRYS